MSRVDVAGLHRGGALRIARRCVVEHTITLVELSEPPSGIFAAIVCSIRQAFLDVLGQADEVRDHCMVGVALVSIVIMPPVGRRRPLHAAQVRAS